MISAGKEKQHKNIEIEFPPPEAVLLVNVPTMKFLIIDGKGDPNGPDFQNAVAALYGISYTIKFWPRKGFTPKNYEEFKVSPLEGLWRAEGNKPISNATPPDKWQWRIMIRQPEFVTSQLIEKAKAELLAKKDNPKIADAKLAEFTEGKSVQVMHIGPYSEEYQDIQKMMNYAASNGLEFCGWHHEIYLGDPRRTKPERLRTVLRHPVHRAEMIVSK